MPGSVLGRQNRHDAITATSFVMNAQKNNAESNGEWKNMILEPDTAFDAK